MAFVWGKMSCLFDSDIEIIQYVLFPYSTCAIHKARTLISQHLFNFGLLSQIESAGKKIKQAVYVSLCGATVKALDMIDSL